MNALPPLPALRSFEAVARLGSVSQAADALCVTHSAVSQQLRLLEQTLGVALLQRDGRGVRLTEAGRQYALQVRIALGGLQEATRLVRSRPRDDELVIATLPSFGQHWLLPRLPDFQRKHPHYRITLRANLDVQDLRDGLVDVAVRMGRGGWEGVQQQHLFHDVLLVVASPGFNQGALPQTPLQIVESPIIGSLESWLPWCQAQGVAEPKNYPLWINDSNLVLAAVQQGLGVALLRLSMVWPLLQQGVLMALSPFSIAHPSAHWLLWPLRESVTRKQEDFADWLHQQVKAWQALSAPGWVPGV